MEKHWIAESWDGFRPGRWNRTSVNVRDFIQNNYTPYEGDESFLAGPTDATKKLWDQVLDLSAKEREAGGVLDMDTRIVSGITSHGPGYLDKDLEQIVGFQTDKPFKRSLQPFGGIRMAQNACRENGYEVDPEVVEIFTKYRKTHNQGVFDVYTPEMRLARKSAIITGLPDAYGRGRIIGDYRRVALYGTDWLIEDKKQQLATSLVRMTGDNIRLREELAEQIRALGELKELGDIYGFDISRPARNAKEAIQWLYFGYLAAVKEQNGAAMSLGRTSTFLDIYIQRDLDRGLITEEQAQEYIDHFIMKLRLVKFARTPEYNSLFSGDPTWVTESIGGVGIDGRPLVTRTSFRYLHTLDNLGTAPEPNLTVLWSTRLPRAFKEYCAKMSIKTSSIQYENDDLMRATHGDDYAIACCVSSMRVGKEMQFFGARANLAKCLLYAINGGMDERMKVQVGPRYRPVDTEYLEYDDVMQKFDDMMEWLAELYVNTLNVIHYMHDKYCYEKLQMALHDREVKRYFATGIAGLSVVADSLSAISFCCSRLPVRNQIREGEARPGRGRPRGGLPGGGRFPQIREQRRPGGRDRRGDRPLLHGQDPQAPHLPPLRPHHVHPDHHLQRGVRQEDGQHAGREEAGRASGSGSQPHAQAGHPRRPGVPGLCGEDPLPPRPGRHLQHLLHHPGGPRQG